MNLVEHQNINLITEKIQQGEGTVGRLINDEDTVDELDGALRDIHTALAPVNDMKIVVNTWGDTLYQYNSRLFQSSFPNKTFNLLFDWFYRCWRRS